MPMEICDEEQGLQVKIISKRALSVQRNTYSGRIGEVSVLPKWEGSKNFSAQNSLKGQYLPPDEIA